MERVFIKWASMNAELIQDVSIPTAEGHMNIGGAELPVDGMGITVITPTEGLKEKRLQELSTMLTAVAPMAGVTGPEPMIGLLMEMANLSDMPVLQRQLKEAMDRPDDGKDQAMQIASMKAQLESMKISAEAQKDIASADKYRAEAEAKRIEAIKSTYVVDTNG
jgi:hypothetical protein